MAFAFYLLGIHPWAVFMKAQNLADCYMRDVMTERFHTLRDVAQRTPCPLLFVHRVTGGLTVDKFKKSLV